MMKRLCLICLPLCLLFCACAVREERYLEPLRGAFEAELQGEMGGVAFAALWQMEGGTSDAARAATLTFYAPQTLEGTVFCRTAAGEWQIRTGGVAVPAPADGPFAELLAAAGGEGDVTATTLTDTGRTCVQGAGFAWEFFSDGTPAALTTPNLTATVVRFTPIGNKN